MSMYEPEIGTRRERRSLPRDGFSADDPTVPWRHFSGENLLDGDILFVEEWNGQRWVKVAQQGVTA